MNMWHETVDELNEIERDFPVLSADQRIEITKIRALLSISQELSLIHNEGIDGIEVYIPRPTPAGKPATAKSEPGPPRRLR